MSNVLQEDLNFCWEQVLKHDPWYRLHHLFAPAQHSETILALHALIGLLEETLDSSEESLTVSRLQWWRTELAPDSARVSAHPALRALRDGFGGQTLPVELTDPLMAQVLLRLQAQPLQDEQGLKDFCNRVGRSRIAAQLGLGGAENLESSDLGSCAGTGLAILVEFAIHSKNQSWWFVPLDSQAKYQFDMHTVQKGDAGSQGFLQALSGWLEAWFDKQVMDTGLLELTGAGMKRYLAANARAHELRTRRMVKDLSEGGAGNPGRWKMTDLFNVWSSSRRV